MKDWIRFIFLINPRLNALCSTEDRYIEGLGCSIKTKGFDEIMEHLDRKIALVNLRVIYNRFVHILKREEFELLQKYFNDEVSVLSLLCAGFSRTSAYRYIARCIQKCESVLIRLGFDRDRLESEFGWQYLRFEKRLRKKEKSECVIPIKTDSSASMHFT